MINGTRFFMCVCVQEVARMGEGGLENRKYYGYRGPGLVLRGIVT